MIPNLPEMRKILMFLWCRHCQKGIALEYARSLTLCPVCRREMRWKEIVYPVGTIPVIDEIVEPTQTIAAKPFEAITLSDLVDLIRGHNRMEMAKKGFIVVHDERPVP